MVFFAAFTLGYFAGVFTALIVFPPKTTELEMQEEDALKPILDLQGRAQEERKRPVHGLSSSLANH